MIRLLPPPTSARRPPMTEQLPLADRDTAEAIAAALPALDLPLPALCEALLFVAAAPTSAEALAKAIGHPVAAIEAALGDLDDELRTSARGLRLQRHGATYALTSAPPAARVVARFLGL